MKELSKSRVLNKSYIATKTLDMAFVIKIEVATCTNIKKYMIVIIYVCQVKLS